MKNPIQVKNGYVTVESGNTILKDSIKIMGNPMAQVIFNAVYHSELVDEKEKTSSFKSRVQEIKDKYNHIFQYPLEHEFKGMETLKRVIFERV